MPSQEKISYEAELYEEEGLYHRIEDIKAQREYQNCRIRSDRTGNSTAELEQETYDDVEGVDRTRIQTERLETYDDVHSVVQDKINDEPISYDDVQVSNLET